MIPAGFEERAAELEAVVQLPESYLAAQARDFAPAADEPRIYAVYRRNWGLYDPVTVRRYILANLLQMEVLDAAIGRFVEELRQQGLYDDALILFLADHGEMNGERALVDKGVYGHPKVARVPLAVKWPHGAEAGQRRTALASLLDLAPTVLGAAGIRPLARLDGLALQAGEEHGRNLLFEAHWHVAPNPAVSLLRELSPGQRYMYTYNLTSEVDELYDLADPLYRNRAADPTFAEIRREMIGELGRVVSADPRWRCYWHPLRLDRYVELGLQRLDTQLFLR
jgi:arylsulfatase A-like enzyme